MKPNAQAAMEFILIVAVALTIIISGAYLFRGYVNTSNDRLIQQKIDEIANELVQKSRRVYFYGINSMSIITIEFPIELNNMFIISDHSNREYYLVVRAPTSAGEQEYVYDADIPLESGEFRECPDIPTCSRDNIECICFPERYFSKGIKNFRLSTTDECTYSSYCVIIREVSREIE